jgi:hypothetical protein
MGGLEPTRREAPDPKSGMSTNFITSAEKKNLNSGCKDNQFLKSSTSHQTFNKK